MPRLGNGREIGSSENHTRFQKRKASVWQKNPQAIHSGWHRSGRVLCLQLCFKAMGSRERGTRSLGQIMARNSALYSPNRRKGPWMASRGLISQFPEIPDEKNAWTFIQLAGDSLPKDWKEPDFISRNPDIIPPRRLTKDDAEKLRAELKT